MRAPIRRTTASYARWTIMFLLVAFAVPSLAQNTKGERPVNNQRQIRETKSKTVKRRDKSKTRDLAGRRLRTKNKSSANSANVGIRQPNPYAGRPRVANDRPVKSQKRTYSEDPSERPRSPKGDLAGHPIRTTRPRKSDAASPNVYSQSGPYMNNPARKPKGDRTPRVNQTTASGQPVVRRVPQSKERAWQGDAKGKPMKPPRSVTSQRQNTYPQPIPYSKYDSRRAPGDRAISNQRELKQTSRLTRPPRTKSAGGGGYSDAQKRGFVKPGRKNVYWGKFSKGEKPYKGDITGAPLRKKNYRSPAAGLVGRDTLNHFPGRPHGDATFSGRRKETVGAPSQRGGWRGDISGNQLRRITPSKSRGAGEMIFPRRLSVTKSGDHAGRSITGVAVSGSRRGEVVGTPIPGKGPGRGTKAVGKGMAGMRGSPTKGFFSQGEDFTGFIKVKGRKSYSSGAGSFSGSSRVRGIPFEAERVSTYRGNLLSGQGKTFEEQGEGFSGYIKARKQLIGGGSVSGQLWNNNNSPITRNRLPASASKPGSFAGHLISGEGKTFEEQGGNFTGYIKARKPAQGGGSVSGQLWNNRNSPITQNRLPSSASKPGSFAGHLISGEGKTFEEQGGNFTGYIKTKKPSKGGGSVSGQLWNNGGESITVLERTGSAEANFHGRTKASTRKMNTDGFDNSGKNLVRQDFTQSPKAVDESTKKHEPNRAGFRIEGSTVRVERPKYTEREHTADGALPGVGPKRASVRASEFSSGALTADRRHNPFAAKEAMKGTYYGGGSASKMGTFHGNLKVKKGSSDRRLHPDARFAHSSENNVKEERSMLTNVKLFWTKLFHKSESQPNSLKEKERKPRYDKREIGLWAE